jgi:S-adenosylmethionine/arginine decarboxylase-like enzyme
VLQPQAAADHLVAELGASRASVVELQRGIFLTERSMPHKPAEAIGKPVVRR